MSQTFDTPYIFKSTELASRSRAYTFDDVLLVPMRSRIASRFDVTLKTQRIDPNTNEILDYNEIDQFVNTRYLSAPEAIWRLFEFPMHAKSHSVTRLAIHLPFENTIRFAPGDEEATLSNDHITTLTAWFELNRSDPFARQFTYIQVPDHYVFSQKKMDY